LKTKALVLKDNGGYDLSQGEMNPVIFEDFVGEVLDREVPPVIWEPFAGHTGVSKTQNFVSNIEGMELISFDLKPSDERVRQADSTMTSPGKPLGGVLFHPTYFGARLCDDAREVGFASSKEAYMGSLRKVAEQARKYLVPGGLICAVGRDYRTGGRRIRLDLWYLEMFEKIGMTLTNVWLSEPDVVLIFEQGV